MFRWCAYCQGFIGEAPPLDDYRVTHGACERCGRSADFTKPEPLEARGERLAADLFKAAREGNFPACRAFAEQAFEEGWRASDAAIGMLQPALYEIGRLWERGAVSVAQEHAFTDWCERVFALLGEEHPDTPGPVRVLICCVEGNGHTLGPRFAVQFLRDRGVRARAVVPGLPDDEILELCRREAPRVLGISASLPASLPRAAALLEKAARLPRPPKTVIGGLAVRTGPAAGLPAARTLDELLDLARS